MRHHEWESQQVAIAEQRAEQDKWDRTPGCNPDPEIWRGPGPRESTVAEAKAAVVNWDRFWFALSTIFPREKIQEIEEDFSRV